MTSGGSAAGPDDQHDSPPPTSKPRDLHQSLSANSDTPTARAPSFILAGKLASKYFDAESHFRSTVCLERPVRAVISGIRAMRATAFLSTTLVRTG